MSHRTIVPFGPQHPVLPEPIHLDLVLEDEKVVEAVPSIGYVHRGLEKLVEKRDYKDYVFIAERICGICSFIHSECYCRAVESVMGIEPPARAEYLRTIWSEYSRMHSHLLWLGLYADSMGYENVFMQAWRMREKILDVFDATTGGRVIQSSCKVGGVRRDVSPELLASMKNGLEDLSCEFKLLDSVFGKDKTIQTRSRNVGILTKQDAAHLGAVGPVVRASGIELDTRQTGYAAYRDLEFEPVVLDGGDCYDRCMVRVGELFSSVSLIRQAINQIPDGETEVKVKGNPDGEFYARAEQPRGEVIHYIKAAGKKNLVRHRVRTPTMANLAPLVSMLKGCELADVPVIVLSIDPCIGCMER